MNNPYLKTYFKLFIILLLPYIYSMEFNMLYFFSNSFHFSNFELFFKDVIIAAMKGNNHMEPMTPSINILLQLLHSEVIKIQMTTELQEETSILGYI